MAYDFTFSVTESRASVVRENTGTSAGLIGPQAEHTQIPFPPGQAGIVKVPNHQGIKQTIT